MVESLISFSLRNRFLVPLVALGLSALGLYSLKVNKIDAIPDLSENQVIVFTECMAQPADCRRSYSRKERRHNQ